MSRRATHLRAPRRAGEGLDVHRSACGLQGVDLRETRAEVSCRKCKAAYARMLLEHLAVGIEERAAEPWTPPPPTEVQRGVSDLGPVERAIVARSVRGDDGERRGPRWPNVKAAVQAWAAFVDEGASVASPSSPGRFEGMPKGTREGRVSNVERAVDDVLGVDRAMRSAFVGGARFGDVWFAPVLCREILAWHLAGRPVYSNSKRRECVQRHDVERADLVALACRITGHEVTPRQVGLVIKQGVAEVRAWLERTGELAPRRVA